MNFWWMVFWAGVGTYLMRSVGVWLPPQWVPSRWLAFLPLAVILVMAVSSLASFVGADQAAAQETWGMAIATLAVVLASLKQLPLFVCIAIGCGVFGAIASLV